jgi:hypothetical protein
VNHRREDVALHERTWGRHAARSALLLLGLLLSGGGNEAWAQSRPVCATLPLRLLDGGPEETAPLDGLLREELANISRSEPVDFLSADRAAPLLEQQGGTCFESDSCLGRIARALEARCVVAVSMTAFGPTLRVSARIVEPDGTVPRHGQVREGLEAGKLREEGRRAVLATALAKLDWKAMRTAPPPEPAAQARVSVPPPARPVERSGGPPMLRLASYALAGAGVAALGTGVVVHLGAGADAKRLAEALRTPDGGDTSQALHRSLRTRAAVTPWLVGGGAAALAAGGLLFLLSPDEPSSTSASVVPTQAGASVVLTGEF